MDKFKIVRQPGYRYSLERLSTIEKLLIMLKNTSYFLIQATIWICAIAFSAWFFGIILGQGIDKEVRRNCLSLEAQSRDFKDAGFWLTPTEKSMCDAIGIVINAPVKNK